MTPDLEEYRGKRDLERSGEPRPGEVAPKGPLAFVVQKHRARRLHYDFRLELDGVLKSWAVPKGPSLDPNEKRLAAMVEDHPLEYGSFEGIIPQGEYGAGEVVVWDRGSYSPDEGGELLFDNREEAQARIRHGLQEGKLSFFLRGDKLKGSWTLVRTRRSDRDWLLIKHRDQAALAGNDVLGQERSVLSGRTVEEVREGVRSPAGGGSADPGQPRGARPAPFPGFVPPMLASVAGAPFSGPEWFFEPKLDGYRAIATVNGGKAAIWSRRGLEVTDKYSGLMPSLLRQPVSSAVLDGEIVAMDAKGRVCFECLQQYLMTTGGPGEGRQFPLIYYVFDIVYLDGFDLRDVSLQARHDLLRRVVAVSDEIRVVESFESDGQLVYEAAVKSGMEGVVAKRKDSLYEAGKRSSAWLKVKAARTDDFIVVGYTAGQGARAGSLGSLLLGRFDDSGKLVFSGHVGSGLDGQESSDVRRRLDALRVERCPLAEEPETNSAPTWVRPELVAEVKFSQRTRDGRLRAPVFVRLRDDKPPGEARPEPVATLPVSVGRSSAGDTLDALLERLSRPGESLRLEVEGSTIGLTNIDKAIWPAIGSRPAITKRHYIKYLVSVSTYLLPHLKDRPLTLSRYPNGVNGDHFWQKHWSHQIPGFVKTVGITEGKGAVVRDYIMCDNLATLIWLGQLADIELHTWFSRVSAQPDFQPEDAGVDTLLDHPDFIIFDLDPYIYSGAETAGAEPELNRAAFSRGCEVALWLKALLDSLSLPAFIKTSGKTGLHIYVPIVRRLDYAQTRQAAETIGSHLLQAHPDAVTMEWAPQRRAGKVFFDYAQNARGKTLASVYSPRPHPEATVSVPLSWDELPGSYPTQFTILTVPERLKQIGDLWGGILAAKRDFAQVVGRQGQQSG